MYNLVLSHKCWVVSVTAGALKINLENLVFADLLDAVDFVDYVDYVEAVDFVETVERV